MINESVAEWEADGVALGERERSARSLMWDVGDWWNRGERYGERVTIVTAKGWTGPKYQTCRDAGWVANRWPVSSRQDRLTFEHHKSVAALADDAALPLLRWASEDPENRPATDLRTRAKQVRRDAREVELGAQTRALPDKRFNVIYADPPWRFEPYSRDSGMDRAADNHYPTLQGLEIAEQIDVPSIAADDAVLFLWATVPMLPAALVLMSAWGFDYKSNFVWVKDALGTGYWNRNQHELLLVGTRGGIPAPAHGQQYASVIRVSAGEHSVKPDAVAEMIEEMFPNLPAIELFARRPRVGWDVWGNEAPSEPLSIDAD